MQHGRKFITSVEIKRSVREWINWRRAVTADEDETWDTYRDTPPERDHPHIWRLLSLYRIPAAFLASFFTGPTQHPLSLNMDVIRGWSIKSDQGKIPHLQLPALKSWWSPVIVDPLFDCMVFKGHKFFCYHRSYLTLLMLPRVSLTNHTLIL